MGESKKTKTQVIKELHGKIEELEAQLQSKDSVMALFVSDMDAMEEKRQSLEKEILKLKQRLSGYKTSNANYRRRIESLEYDYEKQQMANKNFIEGLRIRVEELQLANGELHARLSEKAADLDECNEALERALKPWWKRLF